MNTDPDRELREKTKEMLEKIQHFDIKQLSQEKRLGETYSFHEAIAPATRLIELYSRLPISILDDLPHDTLNNINNRANEDYNQFEAILKFDNTAPTAKGTHDSLTKTLINGYQNTFPILHPYISYSLSKTTDFKRLEREAQATLKSIRDQSQSNIKEMEQMKEQAISILKEVRKVAAEQGVTQQAIYFKESADKHDEEATKWQKRTIWVSVGLTLYALTTLFFHNFAWLKPADTYQAVHIAVSKVLVFAVISYMLYLFARIFLSHKHNSIIDRHRQNALMTYKALVEAAKDTPNKEIILVQAAACIFSPQGTGYTSDSMPQPPGAHSVVEFLSKPLKRNSE
jgi:hypothetical protein